MSFLKAVSVRLVCVLEYLYVWVFVCLLMLVLVYIQVSISHGYIRKELVNSTQSASSLINSTRNALSYGVLVAHMSAHVGVCSMLCFLFRMFVLVYVQVF